MFNQNKKQVILYLNFKLIIRVKKTYTLYISPRSMTFLKFGYNILIIEISPRLFNLNVVLFVNIYSPKGSHNSHCIGLILI